MNFNQFKMKKSILILAVSMFITDAILTGCGNPSPEQKVENAQNNVTEANKQLDKANQEYLADMDNYRKETDAKVAANDKIIADLKARIDMQKKEAQDEYKKKIDELEQKNAEMKKKIGDYKAEGKEKWEQFKAECNHDMDGLSKAFNDLTVKNGK